MRNIHDKETKKNSKKNKLSTLSALFAFYMLVLSVYVAAQSVRASCFYNQGIGGQYVCDSGWVGGNTAQCNAANGVQCATEGNVWCYGYDDSGVQAGPVGAYTVDWDTDQLDCTCKVGTGRWLNPSQFESGFGMSPQCCSDDSGENYAGPENGKSCDGTTALCCNDPNDVVIGGQCVNIVGGGCPQITRVYWSNLIGQEITSTQVDDYVLLVAESPSEGMQVNFNLWEDDPARCYQENYTATVVNGIASVLWKVKLCSDGTTNGNRFRAEMAISPSSFLESVNLAVSTTPNNSPPVARIASPLNGQIFSTSFPVPFNSSSYDVDDPINVLWAFGDGTTSTIHNTTHSYSLGGPVNIVLTATDVRGASDTDGILILIDSPGNDPPFALISSPAQGQKFSGTLITFDARNSTDDVKRDRSPGCNLASGTCWESLIFIWEFDEGPVYQASGTAGAYFTRLFSTAGPHTAKLTVDDADPVGTDEVAFEIQGCSIKVNADFEYVPFGACSLETRHFYCVNDTTYYDTLTSNCQGADGLPKTYDDCCPRGFYCGVSGAACIERSESCAGYTSQATCEQVGCFWLSGTCVDPADFSSCSDYTTQALCQQDLLGLGKAGGRGLGTDVCGRNFGDYIVPRESCKCEWVGSGPCQFTFKSNATVGGNPFITCRKSYTISSCVNGRQDLSWTAVIAPPSQSGNASAQAQCSPGSRQIKCGLPVTKLNFFGAGNFAVVIALIFAYYFFYAIDTKKKSKSGKR